MTAAITALVVFLSFPVSGFSLTIGEEEQLSREYMSILKSRFNFIDDPIIVDYVNSIGNRILSHIPPQPFKYHFYVIQEPVYNAFATPAGHIFVHSGLLEAMDSEEELAGILGHEIAHVIARHISDKIERSKKIGLATLAGIIAGAFLGGNTGGALTYSTLAANQQLSLAFSRQDELQADQLGLNYIAKAGYSASGLLTALNKIRSKNWFGSIPSYLMTHPASEDRIAYIDAWIEKHEEPNPPPKRDPTEFNRMHARLVALYGDEKFALNHFERMLKKDPENALAHYGYGLTLARADRREAAIEQIRLALTTRPFDPFMITDLGRIYYLDGRYREALETLESAEDLQPFDPDRLFYLAQARFQMGQIERASLNLQTLISRRPAYAQAYYSLGEIYSRQENPGYAHYYLGMFYRMKGDLKNAVFHLGRSLQSLTDPEKRSEVEEILHGVKGKPGKEEPPRKPA